MSLTAALKQILNGLAFAHAGDYLSRTEKNAALGGQSAPAPAAALEPAAVSAEHGRIGLYLGSELPEEVLRYVLRTCNQLRHGLTVFTPQSRKETAALLLGYRSELAEAGIDPELVMLSGEPSRALDQALRRRPDIAFLVCNESGYLGRNLRSGVQHALPTPVVLVSRTDGAAAELPTRTDARTSARRAA